MVGDKKVKFGISEATDGQVTQLKQALDSAGFGLRGVKKVCSDARLALFMAASVDELDDPKRVLFQGTFDEWEVHDSHVFTRDPASWLDIINRDGIAVHHGQTQGKLERWWVDRSGCLIVEVSRRESHRVYHDYYRDGQCFAKLLDSDMTGDDAPCYFDGSIYYSESKGTGHNIIYRILDGGGLEKVLEGKYHEWRMSEGNVFTIDYEGRDGVVAVNGKRLAKIGNLSRERYRFATGEMFVLSEPRVGSDEINDAHLLFVRPSDFCGDYARKAHLLDWQCRMGSLLKDGSIVSSPTFEWQNNRTGVKTLVHANPHGRGGNLECTLPYADWRVSGSDLFVRFYKPNGGSVVLRCDKP